MFPVTDGVVLVAGYVLEVFIKEFQTILPNNTLELLLVFGIVSRFCMITQHLPNKTFELEMYTQDSP